MQHLRAWQQQALEAFLAAGEQTWLTTATPGAGKTMYALAAVRTLWGNRWVSRLIVVTPTDHLRRQWIDAAREVGFDLRSTPNDEVLPADADGMVVTYAQVAARPRIHTRRTDTAATFVVFDEIHHAGDDKSWGAGVLDAFAGATVRFAVTGTPFRSDQARIAFVDYVPTGDGGHQSRANFSYGYGEALRDGVVRPVTFAAYAGEATWRDSAGQVISATLGDRSSSKHAEESAWRTALDPDGEWIPHVMAAAWARVQELRRTSMPDAAVLIPASSQAVARQYAEVWESVTGDKPLLVLSDDPASAKAIARFRDDPDVVAAVCVRLITEGVDIPRAAVLAYTTTASTPLFFAQMVGRVIRARNRREGATVFLPAVRHLLQMAAEMEVERDHVLAAAAESDQTAEGSVRLPAAAREEGESWQPMSASASLSTVLGTHHPGPAPDQEVFGLLDGLLTVEQEKVLLGEQEQARQAQAREVAAARRAARASAEEARAEAVRESQWTGQPAAPATVCGGGDVERLRGDIARAVAVYASAAGIPHAQVWKMLYARTPGPKNAAASVKLLTRRWQAINSMR